MGFILYVLTMLKQNERIINMAKAPFSKRVSLTDEEFRLIRNLLRLEYIKYQVDYDKYSNSNTLAILNLVENTRRKFKLEREK